VLQQIVLFFLLLFLLIILRPCLHKRVVIVVMVMLDRVMLVSVGLGHVYLLQVVVVVLRVT